MYTNRIDRVRIFTAVREASNRDLSSFSDDAVKRFAIDSKKILESAFDRFVLETDQYYSSDDLGAIQDTDCLLRFSDVADGYRHQMKQWVKDNPVSLTTDIISPADFPTLGIFQRKSVRKSLTTLLGGNIIIVGLRLLTGAGWVWWLELAALYAAMKSGQKGHQEDLLWELRIRKDALINGIISDMSAWLDAAERKHYDTLKSFGIE